MSKRFVGSVAVVLGATWSLAWSSTAGAQEWLKDRRYQEGAGYRTGDLEIHPGIAGEIGYDSNWFLRSDKTGATISNGAPAFPEEGGGVIRITPSLSISTIGPQRREQDKGATGAETEKFNLNAGISATYREFIGSDDLRRQRNASGNAHLRLGILPGRPWGAEVFATYDRTIQPTVFGNPDLSFNRGDIGAGAELIAQPNSGTLDWRVGYTFHTTLFEQSQGSIFNNAAHVIGTRGRWKFRPRTAMLYDASFGFRTYSRADEATTALHESTPLRARLGMNGLITPRFSLLAMAGWAASFYNTKGGTDPTVQQYDSVIGQVEAKFFPTSSPGDDPGAASLVLSSIAVGYMRDYQTSYLGDFYGIDRGYTKISYFFAGRALISLEGGVGAIEYPNIYPNANTPQGAAGQALQTKFTDIRADATLFGEYRFTETVGVNTTLKYTENFSNTQIPVVGATAGSPGSVYDMSWRRFEAYLGIRWFM